MEAKERAELTPEQQEQVQRWELWWDQPEGRHFRRFLEWRLREMQTDWAKGQFVDRTSADRSALLNSEAVGGALVLDELIRLEGVDLLEVA